MSVADRVRFYSLFAGGTAALFFSAFVSGEMSSKKPSGDNPGFPLPSDETRNRSGSAGKPPGNLDIQG